MKKLLFLPTLLFLLSGCHREEKNFEPFPLKLVTEDDWITYEGDLPIKNELLHAELRLKTDPVAGEGLFWFTTMSPGMNTEKNKGLMSCVGDGIYTLLYGKNDQRIVQLNNVKYYTWQGPNKRPLEGSFNFIFRINGDHELVLLDDNFNEVTPARKLTRRSRLFTVEGYFTITSDTTDFFEKNALQYWPVSPLGSYKEAVSKYHVLAKEQYEGVYIKALSYSVHHVGRDGKEQEALVFKRILQMGMENL
jgi:hypothetical protein